MKRLLLIALLLLPFASKGQVETIEGIEAIETIGPDTVYLLRTDTVTRWINDTIIQVRTDTVIQVKHDTVVRREADTAALKALQEKEIFYREILSSNGVDKEKLEAERNYYIHVVDSLRTLIRIAELENVRKEEANKYLEERARAAEERVAQATNRKKKVRPIQGIAMRFYRTPMWEIRLNANSERYIANRNAGNVEFDFATGASVMLWDLTKYFNKPHTFGSDSSRIREIPRFDQEFAYDLGFYVGFGGSNLFKNFYVGPSFRFVDFFYITVGVNIAEYTVLADGYESGEVLLAGQSIDDITAKAWLIKPFISINIDLDFLSYIKR
jgi:hypothetical protein